jgi:hypothetical protein
VYEMVRAGRLENLETSGCEQLARESHEVTASITASDLPMPHQQKNGTRRCQSTNTDGPSKPTNCSVRDRKSSLILISLIRLSRGRS